ncbi:MAG: hypothetical protein SAL70_43060 [Scytonema sp. PMC 1070.18]|nr:hypothetical protein [Scytonema sp. PMC 1070.18]
MPDDRKECIQARTEELEAERLTLQEHGILSRVKLSMNIRFFPYICQVSFLNTGLVEPRELKTIAVLRSPGHGKVILDILRRQGHTVAAFVADTPNIS